MTFEAAPLGQSHTSLCIADGLDQSGPRRDEPRTPVIFLEGPRYDFHNFFEHTVANFTRCEVPDRPPDFVSFSGSAYWDLGDRVRRWSDHWGPNVGSCRWYLDFATCRLTYCLCGECLYEDFRPTMSLYEPAA